MGVTYRAIDKALDRQVALKIINTDGSSRSAEARERFMREARAAAALRHPNVATVYQFGVREATGQFFYAMELVEGETLEERVRRLGPLDVLTTIDIALQVTAALEAAKTRPGASRLKARQPNAGWRKQRSGRDGPPGRPSDIAARCPYHKSDRLRRGQNDRRENKRDGAHARRLRRDSGICQPGTIHQCACRCALGHLLVRRDALVFADWTHALQRPDSRRDSRGAPIKAIAHQQLKAAHVPRRLISLLMSMLAIEPAARPAGARELSARLQAIRASITGRGKTVARVALAAAIVVFATILLVREFHSTKATPFPIPDKSIAVLHLRILAATGQRLFCGRDAGGNSDAPG